MNSSSFQSELTGMRNVMLNFAFTLTHNSDDAQDLVQDTMLKAITAEDKYTTGENFKGGVFTIMRNIFIDQYHKMSRLSTVHDTTEDSYILNVASADLIAESPEDSYSSYEIEEAIRHLDKLYRIPLVMLVSGYKYNEIADEMGLTIGAVKSRIFTGRHLLQERLSDHR